MTRAARDSRVKEADQLAFLNSFSKQLCLEPPRLAMEKPKDKPLGIGESPTALGPSAGIGPPCAPGVSLLAFSSGLRRAALPWQLST